MPDEAIRDVVNKLASSIDKSPRTEREGPYGSYDTLLRGAKTAMGGKTSVFEGIALMDYMDERRERRGTRTENTGSSPELTAIKTKLENMEKREEERVAEERRQRELLPLRTDILATRQEIQGIRAQLANLGKPLKTRPEEDAPGKDLKDRLDKAEERYEQLKDKLSDRERKTFEKRIEFLENRSSPEASDLKRIETALDTYDRIAKRGKGESGEFDWKTMAISTTGDIAREGLQAYKEMSKELSKEAAASTSPQVDEVTKRQVLNYALTQIKRGAKNVDVNKGAEYLGITPREVYNALEILNKEGALLTTGRAGAAKKTRED